jgi:hypothetical protein
VLPPSTAFAEPDPLTVASIVASTGTVDSRALNICPLWAMAQMPPNRTRIAIKKQTFVRCFGIAAD